MKKKMKYLIIINIIIMIILSYYFNQRNNLKYSDDVIFFKLFSNSKQQIQDKRIKTYYFNIDSNNKEQILKNIDLLQTINVENVHDKTINNKKIAPGTKGQFEIVLQTNKKILYQIYFENYGEKPENLSFKINGSDKKFKDLKDLEQFIKGILNKKETKNFIIEWNWDYDRNYEDDIQDTNDGKRIKEYHFDINVTANEI